MFEKRKQNNVHKKLILSFVLAFFMSLLLFGGNETVYARTGYNSVNHNWYPLDPCVTCGGDHLITTYKACTSSTCTSGKTYSCVQCDRLYKTRPSGTCTKCGWSTAYMQINCPTCGGTGKVVASSVNCSKCYGSPDYAKGKNTYCRNSGCQYGSWGTPAAYFAADQTCYETPKSYNFSIHANGGTFSNGSTDIGMSPQLTFDSSNWYNISSYIPSRAGYSFNGFYDSPSGGTLVYFSNGECNNSSGYWSGNVYKHDGDLNVYAQWTPIKYNVTYHGNGSTSGWIGAIEYTYDTVYTYPAQGSLYRTGYTFTGWGTTETSGVDCPVGAAFSNLTASSNGSINRFAQWTPNIYTVYFHGNGGTASYGSQNVAYDSTYGTLPTATRTGFRFDGWFTEPGGGSQVTSATQFNALSNVTLYAHWTRLSYTVTYVAGNGATCSVSSERVLYDYPVNLGYKASLDGKVFVGWHTNANSKVAIPNLQMPAGNVTLYAIYSIPISDIQKVYVMSWRVGNEANYRTVEMQRSAIYNLDYEYILSNANIRLDLTGTLQYAVVAQDNAGNVSILYKSSPPPEIALYVQKVEHLKWDTAVKDWVQFDTTSEIVLKGVTYTPGFVTPPSGYKTDTIDAPYVVTADTTKKAYYIPNEYTLYFDPNGGTTTLSSKRISYSDVYGELPTAERDGYTFLGWYTKPLDGERKTATSRYMIAGDSTLYAHWKINSHQVIYDYQTNGGTSASKLSQTVAYNSPIDLSVGAVKEGWNLVGWNTEKTATTGLTSMNMPDDDVILYAIYRKDIVGTFIDNKDTETVTRKETISIFNNTVDGILSVPEQNEMIGWTALGWAVEEDPNAVVQVASGGSYATTDSLTFYGRYEKDVTVAYDTNGSAQIIRPVTKQYNFSSSGQRDIPEFEIAKAPVLDKNSFVEWQELNEEGAPISRYEQNKKYFIENDVVLVAKWDAHPEIEAYDRHFTLEDAQNGNITEDALLQKVIATDKEDGVLMNGLSVVVKDYDSSKFTSMIYEDEVLITYVATDSFGNKVEANVKVTITDTTASITNRIIYPRFISSDFYKDGENYVPTSLGGLEENSIWRKSEIYQATLDYAMSNHKENEEYKTLDVFGTEYKVKIAGSGDWSHMKESWSFTKEDIKEVREFVDTYGFGNNTRSDAVNKFYEQFDRCKTK